LRDLISLPLLIEIKVAAIKMPEYGARLADFFAQAAKEAGGWVLFRDSSSATVV
jgi:predicted chitinase